MTPETSIKKAIKEYMRLMGWHIWHNLQGLGSYPGVADLTAVKDGRVLFIEVKTKHGKQSENQMIFENDIRTHGGEYVVARSVDDIKEIGGE